MTKNRFDPFEDRLARVIRNELSKAFIKSLEALDMTPVKIASEPYLNLDIASFYHAYIEDRLRRYEKSTRTIVKKGNHEVIFQALVLWDEGLFFEVHELLEEAWHHASGPHAKVLQALIRAAGVYVHLAQGNMKGASRMAAKAVESLEMYRDEVPDYVNLERLCGRLKALDPHPPKLLTK